jgi:predicted dehydrogenase
MSRSGASTDPVRVAILGCGAVAEKFYLPALGRSPRLRIAALVDESLARAQRLAPAGQEILVTRDYRDVVASAEAAVVALPNHLHAPVTIDLLRRGIHVLVEKPMALNVRDCDAMISAANEAKVVLSVGHMRRFYGSCRFVADALAVGLLGRILSFDLRDGGVFNWPLASDYLLRRDAAGGGVLMDLGVHDLDLLMWWLGDYKSVVYRDDSAGGVEANCELGLTLQNGVSGVVELSRTRVLRNSCIIRGERGVLEIATSVNPLIRLTPNQGETPLTGRGAIGGRIDVTFADTFARQLSDFAECVRSQRRPFVSGEDARRVIGLVEACYAGREPLVLPWADFPSSRKTGP